MATCAAYQMLGWLSEADEAVQEAWIRLNRSDTSAVGNLRGWLTTGVARVALDMLRSRQSRREEPLEDPRPEPISSHEQITDPEHEAVLAESVRLALLVVLDTLTPAERIAFVLHDLFAVPFDDIAVILDPPPTPPQLVSIVARGQFSAVVKHADRRHDREMVCRHADQRHVR